MKAIVLTKFGGPECLEIRDVPTPAPGPGGLLVRVLAAAVNPLDAKLRSRRGRMGIELPAILGYDAAGIVEAVGPGVSEFSVGDKVFYSPGVDGPGCYAEYHIAKAEQVALKPANLTFLEAASIPLAGSTAWDGLFTTAGLKAGETALIHAAAGGVGSLAVQLAKSAGARVIGVTSAANTDFVHALGADVVIDRHTDEFADAVLRETGGIGAEVIFDTVGGETVARSIAAARPHGRITSIVRVEGNLDPAYLKNLTLHFLLTERTRAKLHLLRDAVDGGKLHAVIDSVFPLDQVAAAHERLERGGLRGKIVLQVAPEAVEK